MSEEKRLTRRGPDQQDWFVVAQPNGDADTAIIVGALKSADIPFWVYREAASTAIVVAAGLLASIDVLVPEEYYEEAAALLGLGGEPILDDGELALDGEDVIDPSADAWTDDDDPGDDAAGHG